MSHVDLKGHALLALYAVAGAGVVVIGTLDGQRHRNSQRLAEVLASSAVLERIVIRRVVHCAALVGRLVVGLNHSLVRIGVENYNKKKIKIKIKILRMKKLM